MAQATDKIPLNIILIGKAGHGKSATGNSILGRTAFKTYPRLRLGTKGVTEASAEHGPYEIKVVDGPGLEVINLEGVRNKEQMFENMTKALMLCRGEIHAFVLVVKFWFRYTEEDRKAIYDLKEILGENYLKDRGIIVMTGGYSFSGQMEASGTPGKTFKEWCREQDTVLGDLIRECSPRVVLFNNLPTSDEEQTRQRNELLFHAGQLQGVSGNTTEHVQTHTQVSSKLITDSKKKMLEETIQKRIDMLSAELGQLSIDSSLEDVETLGACITGVFMEIVDEDLQEESLQQLTDTLVALRITAEELSRAIRKNPSANKVKAPYTTKHVQTNVQARDKLITESKQKMLEETIQKRISLLSAELGQLSVDSSLEDVDTLDACITGVFMEIVDEDLQEESLQPLIGRLEGLRNTTEELRRAISLEDTRTATEKLSKAIQEENLSATISNLIEECRQRNELPFHAGQLQQIKDLVTDEDFETYTQVRSKFIKDSKQHSLNETMQKRIDLLSAELEQLSVDSSLEDVDKLDARITDVYTEIGEENWQKRSMQQFIDRLKRLRTTTVKLRRTIREKNLSAMKQNLTEECSSRVALLSNQSKLEEEKPRQRNEQPFPAGQLQKVENLDSTEDYQTYAQLRSKFIEDSKKKVWEETLLKRIDLLSAERCRLSIDSSLEDVDKLDVRITDVYTEIGEESRQEESMQHLIGRLKRLRATTGKLRTSIREKNLSAMKQNLTEECSSRVALFSNQSKHEEEKPRQRNQQPFPAGQPQKVTNLDSNEDYHTYAQLRSKFIKDSKQHILDETMQKRVDLLSAELEQLSLDSSLEDVDKLDVRITDVYTEIGEESRQEDSMQHLIGRLKRLRATTGKLRRTIREKNMSAMLSNFIEECSPRVALSNALPTSEDKKPSQRKELLFHEEHLQKVDAGEVPCYCESQPAGCIKKTFPYKHSKPALQDGQTVIEAVSLQVDPTADTPSNTEDIQSQNIVQRVVTFATQTSADTSSDTEDIQSQNIVQRVVTFATQTSADTSSDTEDIQSQNIVQRVVTFATQTSADTSSDTEDIQSQNIVQRVVTSATQTSADTSSDTEDIQSQNIVQRVVTFATQTSADTSSDTEDIQSQNIVQRVVTSATQTSADTPSNTEDIQSQNIVQRVVTSATQTSFDSEKTSSSKKSPTFQVSEIQVNNDKQKRESDDVKENTADAIQKISVEPQKPQVTTRKISVSPVSQIQQKSVTAIKNNRIENDTDSTEGGFTIKVKKNLNQSRKSKKKRLRRAPVYQPVISSSLEESDGESGSESDDSIENIKVMSVEETSRQEALESMIKKRAGEGKAKHRGSSFAVIKEQALLPCADKKLSYPALDRETQTVQKNVHSLERRSKTYVTDTKKVKHVPVAVNRSSSSSSEESDSGDENEAIKQLSESSSDASEALSASSSSDTDENSTDGSKGLDIRRIVVDVEREKAARKKAKESFKKKHNQNAIDTQDNIRKGRIIQRLTRQAKASAMEMSQNKERGKKRFVIVDYDSDDFMCSRVQGPLKLHVRDRLGKSTSLHKASSDAYLLSKSEKFRSKVDSSKVIPVRIRRVSKSSTSEDEQTPLTEVKDKVLEEVILEKMKIMAQKSEQKLPTRKSIQEFRSTPVFRMVQRTDRIPLNLILIGKTGHGKSATGNSLLGQKAFQTSLNAHSETKSVTVAWAEHGLYEVKVVDGPGLEDTDLDRVKNKEQACGNMATALMLCNGGIHAFVLVIKLGAKYTTEERRTISDLKQIFGEDYLKDHGIIVMTGGDSFSGQMKEDGTPGKTFNEWCREQVQHFGDLIKECSPRVVLFNNISKSEEEKTRQRDELLFHAGQLQKEKDLYTTEHFQTYAQVRSKFINDSKHKIWEETIQKRIHLLSAELGRLSVDSSLEDVDKLDARIKDVYTEIGEESRQEESMQQLIGSLKRLSTTTEELRRAIQEKNLSAMKSQLMVMSKHEKELNKTRKIPWGRIAACIGVGLTGAAVVAGGIAAIVVSGGTLAPAVISFAKPLLDVAATYLKDKL